MTKLIALLHRASEGYGVSFPDLLGCISHGATLDEALANAREAAIFHIEGLVEDGGDVPEPRPLDALRRDPEHSESFDTAELFVEVQLPAIAGTLNSR